MADNPDVIYEHAQVRSDGSVVCTISYFYEHMENPKLKGHYNNLKL